MNDNDGTPSGAIPEWMATEQPQGNDSTHFGAGNICGTIACSIAARPTKLVGGVCGNIAEYLGWDPVLVRVLWVVRDFSPPGAAVLAYILLAMFLPTGTNKVGQLRPPAIELSQKGVTWAAALLMGLGGLWLLANLGILPGLWAASGPLSPCSSGRPC